MDNHNSSKIPAEPVAIDSNHLNTCGWSGPFPRRGSACSARGELSRYLCGGTFGFVQKVRHTRRFRADMKGTDPVFDRQICLCHSLMLAQMFNPGFQEKAFQIAALLGRIRKKPPVRCSIAPAEGAQDMHFTDEVV